MLNQAETVAVSVTVTLGCLAIIAVSLRIYCRVYQKTHFGGDDYCIIAALLISTGIAILTDYVACTNDIGDQSHEPTFEAVVFALQTNLALENFQVLGLCLVKISLLLYYKRIFVLDQFTLSANILIGINAAFTLSIILVNIFDKWPVYEQWNPMAPYTVNVAALLIAFTAGNAALDVLTLFLPLSVIKMLHVNVGRKLLLGVIFSLGSITVIVTFLRLKYSIEYTREPETGNSFFEVPFIYNILMALIELPVFIITNCLLTLGPLFRSHHGPGKLFQSLRSLLISNLSKSRESAKDLPISSQVPHNGETVESNKLRTWGLLNEQTPTPSTEQIRNRDWEPSKMNAVHDHAGAQEVV